MEIKKENRNRRRAVKSMHDRFQRRGANEREVDRLVHGDVHETDQCNVVATHNVQPQGHQFNSILRKLQGFTARSKRLLSCVFFFFFSFSFFFFFFSLSFFTLLKTRSWQLAIIKLVCASHPRNTPCNHNTIQFNQQIQIQKNKIQTSTHHNLSAIVCNHRHRLYTKGNC
jgi:hypothetical protein